jgi:hypothetical protein
VRVRLNSIRPELMAKIARKLEVRTSAIAEAIKKEDRGNQNRFL